MLILLKYIVCCIVWIILQVCFHLKYFLFFVMINMGGFQCCRYHNHHHQGKRLYVKSSVEKLSKCYALNTTQSSTDKIFTCISYKVLALLFHVVIRKDAICICLIFILFWRFYCCCKFYVLNTFLLKCQYVVTTEIYILQYKHKFIYVSTIKF